MLMFAGGCEGARLITSIVWHAVGVVHAAAVMSPIQCMLAEVPMCRCVTLQDQLRQIHACRRWQHGSQGKPPVHVHL